MFLTRVLIFWVTLQPEEFPPRKLRFTFVLLGLILLAAGAYIIVSGHVVVEMAKEVGRGTFDVLPPDAKPNSVSQQFLGFSTGANIAVTEIDDGRIVYDLDTKTYIAYSIRNELDYGLILTGGFVAGAGALATGLGFFKGAPPRSTTMSVMGREVKIRVDWDSCMGASSCITIAPKVFRLDPERMKSVFMSRAPLEVLDEKGADPETIFLAAQSCPYKAIILEDARTEGQIFP